MVTTAALTENSRQGINFPIRPCTGPKAWLSPKPRPGCGHAYDETPVGLVVYVRNDPVNYIDPDGRHWTSGLGSSSDRMEDWFDFLVPSPPPLVYGDMPFLGDDGFGGNESPWLKRWNGLSEECRIGLEDAMPAGGASAETAAMLRLKALDRANASSFALQTVVDGSDVDWRMMAAIGIRETGFVNIEQSNGFGRGVFQIDIQQNPSVTGQNAGDLSWAAIWVANYLQQSYDQINGIISFEDPSNLSIAVAASYNRGLPGTITDITRGISPDVKTTRHNYGTNVFNLMSCFN